MHPFTRNTVKQHCLDGLVVGCKKWSLSVALRVTTNPGQVGGGIHTAIYRAPTKFRDLMNR